MRILLLFKRFEKPSYFFIITFKSLKNFRIWKADRGVRKTDRAEIREKRIDGLQHLPEFEIEKSCKASIW
jgi:hypothetical protein